MDKYKWVKSLVHSLFLHTAKSINSQHLLHFLSNKTLLLSNIINAQIWYSFSTSGFSPTIGLDYYFYTSNATSIVQRFSEVPDSEITDFRE